MYESKITGKILKELRLKEEVIQEKFRNELAHNGFEVSKMYCFDENNDMVSAIVRMRTTNAEYSNGYYLASLNYKNEFGIPKREIKMQEIDYMGGQ